MLRILRRPLSLNRSLTDPMAGPMHEQRTANYWNPFQLHATELRIIDHGKHSLI